MPPQHQDNSAQMATTEEMAATDYLNRCWSVIPIRPSDKRPLLLWREYQARRPEPEEVHAWVQRWPTANIGIVNGAVSGLVVMDIDPAHRGIRRK